MYKSAAFCSFVLHTSFWSGVYYLSHHERESYSSLPSVSPVSIVWDSCTAEKHQDIASKVDQPGKLHCYDKSHLENQPNPIQSVRGVPNPPKNPPKDSRKIKKNTNLSLDGANNTNEAQEKESNEGKGPGNFFPSPANPLPRYPEEARDLQLEGKATFRLSLDKKGTVTHVGCLNKDFPTLLKNEAIKTLITWTFYGQCPGTVDVLVKFVFEDEQP